MDLLSDEYIDARNLMVDGQVRPNRVTDPRIVATMRRLPRHLFVPPAVRSRAYADEDVPLGGGRVLVEPMVIARLVQLAAPREGDRALVVGAGAGYGAAVLAGCGATVTALEEDAALRDLARTALAGVAGVAVVAGPLADGWAAGAPYDVILIEGAAEELPPALAAQLRNPGGRLVGVLAGAHIGRAVLGEPSTGGLSLRRQFDCATPTLPALRRRPAFVF
jgi:protein-L-isoaspartate(D-aspartate) O-methyltransferase